VVGGRAERHKSRTARGEVEDDDDAGARRERTKGWRLATLAGSGRCRYLVDAAAAAAPAKAI